MIKKHLFSAFTLQAAYKKGFKEGSKLWRYGFIVVVLFRILKWLFTKAQPVVVDEYELAPGEYTVVVDKQSKGKK